MSDICSPTTQRYAHFLPPFRKIVPQLPLMNKKLPLMNKNQNKKKTVMLPLASTGKKRKCINYHFISTASVKMLNFTLNTLEGTQQ